ncbi:MAG TPA: MJ0042-type zinc finger domain-containing protein [Geopsychrobacteraceae bacterium]|jgi:predicted Zn finger-like uncharacterized protein
MIVECPACQASLRLDAQRYAGKRLALRCPACRQSCNVEVPIDATATVLIAHGCPKSFAELQAVLAQDGLSILTCSERDEALRLLRDHPVRILLLDVALTGAFPFELIEQAQRKSAEKPVKIILLPSVYNKTAYKRRPTSLYGADAYLELHHIGDRLLPLLRELCPDLELNEPSAGFYRSAQEEERGPADVGAGRAAEELARLLIADIALYHQERIDRGIRAGDPALYLADQLAEGRRILAERIAPANLEPQDFLLRALRHFADDRRTTV